MARPTKQGIEKKERPGKAVEAGQGVRGKSIKPQNTIIDINRQDSNGKGNSAASQRARILNHLQTIGYLTTIQARHSLDCMHPGMRICELRKMGFSIETVWVYDVTPEGNLHRVARYILPKPRQLSLIEFIQQVGRK